MRRQYFSGALLLVTACSALVLSGCATISTRISAHPEIYQNLSPRDQELVSQGRIREGMSQGAVFLAWGAPEQKGFGRMRAHRVETWIYRATTYAYTPYPYYGASFYPGVGYYHLGRHGHVHAFYDPFYDPFFYPRFQPVSYPYKTVTFENDRVIAFATVTPPTGGY
jgi:hypothetical protein